MRHLKSFHVFHMAASFSNYSKAANELNITHGAVSKQIKVLEDYLSISLFYKKGRNVCLTKEGELLKEYTEQAFNALDTGVNRLHQMTSTSIEVSCEPTLTMRWLMPRLSNFHDNVGGDIRLSTAGGAVVLGSTGLSMAIRRDDFEIRQDYKQTMLGEEWVGPVFSPEYWKRVKQDLSQVTLLHSKTWVNAWSNWAKDNTEIELGDNSVQMFDHFYFCFQAAVDGLGGAIGSYPLVMDDLKRGNLIAPFGFSLSGYNYILLSEDRAKSQQEKEFIDWLESNFKECLPINNLI
ncbi:LysR family transcriptional regulator [Aliivibrio fischeri]|uniref:LysR family transcriptional regulator n=1 Tax=Aliivibrio fischeri TaxID=668 RepID=UPI0007C57517|nr:LysR family transcriptional regulator [Aliivibrio fischeri]